MTPPDDEGSLALVSAESLDLLWVEHADLLVKAVLRSFRVQAPHFHVHVDQSPDAALTRILSGAFPVVLVDRTFPSAEKGGLELCRRVREVRDDIALVMLSAWDNVNDRTEALEAGADDFVAKEALSTRDLCARLCLARQKAKKRSSSVPSPFAPAIHLGSFEIEVLHQTIRSSRTEVSLSGRPWRLLLRLALARGCVVPPDELCRFSDIQPSKKHKNLHTEISRLRDRLSPIGNIVLSVRGAGYQLTTGGPDSYQI